MRFLAELASTTNSAVYQDFARRQADSLWVSDRDPLNRIGRRWAGGTPNQADWRTRARSAYRGFVSARGVTRAAFRTARAAVGYE
ncbi:hypothetical protein [Amycolatopsis sp. cmx-11-51]|uniref:hypothetical protein n=1 Tax=unclassified Amycolatopsis TaxID=2618356 RepID=UPI0039E592EB